MAGSVSAGLSHGYTTPLDVIKTRMQTHPELYNGSVAMAARMIVEKDGPSILLQGLVPTLVGYGLEGAIKFGSYEMCKPLFAVCRPALEVRASVAAWSARSRACCRRAACSA